MYQKPALSFVLWGVLTPLAGCRCDDLPSPPPKVALLTPEEHAMRASMALRGLHPSGSELDRVRADPDVIDDLVDEWIASPEFAATIRDMHGEQLLVRNATTGLKQLPQYAGLAPFDDTQIQHSSSEEPLKLIEKIVTEGHTYSEIVTANYMMTDQILSIAFGPAWDPAGPEWQVSHWTDGRPHSGLLSSTQMWRRFTSNANNFHRARADAVLGLFLCDPMSARLVDFGNEALPITSDSAAVADALMDNPACTSCHQILDPIAATFWGFKRILHGYTIEESYAQGCPHELLLSVEEEGIQYIDDYCYPIDYYNPENEGMWQTFGLRPPGYYGKPIADLSDLGRELAADPRFATCSVKRFVSYFEQVPINAVPQNVVDALLPVFEDSDQDARQLVRAIVLSDPFRARAAAPGAPWIAGIQTTRPEQLQRVLGQLLGFAYTAMPDRGVSDCRPYCTGAEDLLLTDEHGYLALLGGVDAKLHPIPIHTATPLRDLALSQILSEAAASVVTADLTEPDKSKRRLFSTIDGSETGGETVRTQIAALHETLLAEDVSDTELDETVALFDSEIARSGDPGEAWRLVVAALLRDPHMLHY